MGFHFCPDAAACLFRLPAHLNVQFGTMGFLYVPANPGTPPSIEKMEKKWLRCRRKALKGYFGNLDPLALEQEPRDWLGHYFPLKFPQCWNPDAEELESIKSKFQKKGLVAPGVNALRRALLAAINAKLLRWNFVTGRPWVDHHVNLSDCNDPALQPSAAKAPSSASKAPPSASKAPPSTSKAPPSKGTQSTPSKDTSSKATASKPTSSKAPPSKTTSQETTPPSNSSYSNRSTGPSVEKHSPKARKSSINTPKLKVPKLALVDLDVSDSESLKTLVDHSACKTPEAHPVPTASGSPKNPPERVASEISETNPDDMKSVDIQPTFLALNSPTLDPVDGRTEPFRTPGIKAETVDDLLQIDMTNLPELFTVLQPSTPANCIPASEAASATPLPPPIPWATKPKFSAEQGEYDCVNHTPQQSQYDSPPSPTPSMPSPL